MNNAEYTAAVEACKEYIGQAYTSSLRELISLKSGFKAHGLPAGFVGHYGDATVLLVLDENEKITSVIVRPTQDTFSEE